MTRLATIALIPVLALLLMVAGPAPGHAQVRLGIGIGIPLPGLPGPPTLTVIPGMPVYYAPSAPANVFFYAHQYWLFANGGWHVGPSWNGPWAVVEPMYVPAPILQVPIRYYPVPPPEWQGWRPEGSPQWEPQHGQEWRDQAHEREWREREEHWNRGEGRGCPPGLAKQGRC